MTCQHDHRHSIFCILPPHILEQIVKNGRPEERDWALRTLSTDSTLRNLRTTRTLMRSRAERSAPTAAPNKERRVYSAGNGMGLPGTLLRAEGQPPTGDVAADEAYAGLGATFDLYWTQYQRNSIDNAGLPLSATAHFGNKYNNAFWDGSLMVFGDGDGQFFNRFTIAIDIMAHELTHGVTGAEAGLIYQNQSGALNESMSDVFGSMVKQFAHSPQQKASEADWLIGAGLFTSRVNGVALRSMKSPGTAYDDSVLGKDPQPAHMDQYNDTTADNGGVHINSGIPNRAFYLAAVALGGYAWQKAGRIWYATLRDARLQPDAQFQDFANLTVEHAAQLFSSAEAEAVAHAWQQVGIATSARVQSKVSGDWVLHFSWGPTNAYSQAPIVFNANGTFGGANTGKWQQQDGTILLSFDSGLAKYGGNIEANIGSGAMSTFNGLDGCWYLTKKGTTGITLPAGRSEYDAAGNLLAAAVEAGTAQELDIAGNAAQLSAERSERQRFDAAGNVRGA